VVFDQVGHFPHCEAPERFVEALVDFIASTEPAQLSEGRWRQLLQSHPTSSAAFATVTNAADSAPVAGSMCPETS
jgi:hypothetical protein